MVVGSVEGGRSAAATRANAFANEIVPDQGLDGDNNRRTTDIRDGMRPLVTSVGLEAVFEVAEGLTLEERFRWSDVSGRFVSPFPSEVGAAAGAYAAGQF